MKKLVKGARVEDQSVIQGKTEKEKKMKDSTNMIYEEEKPVNGARDEDKHPCSFCDQSFNERKYLNRHMRKQHPSEWDTKEKEK
jgi:hypothetical protein